MDWIANNEEIKKIVELMKNQYPETKAGHDIIEEATKHIGTRFLLKGYIKEDKRKKDGKKEVIYTFEYNKFAEDFFASSAPNMLRSEPGYFGYSFCAMFETSVFERAGHSLGVILDDDPEGTGRKGYKGVRNGASFWEKTKQLTNYPVPGDVVLYKGAKHFHHTGIFICWENFPLRYGNVKDEDYNFYTIEGNTEGPYLKKVKGGEAERSGGSVVMKRRSLKSGIGRPYFAHPIAEEVSELIHGDLVIRWRNSKDFEQSSKKIIFTFLPPDSKSKSKREKKKSEAGPHIKPDTSTSPCPSKKEDEKTDDEATCKFQNVRISGANHTFQNIIETDLGKKERILKIVSGYSKENATIITINVDSTTDSCTKGHDKKAVFDFDFGKNNRDVLVEEPTTTTLKFKPIAKTSSFEESSHFKLVAFKQNGDWLDKRNLEVININTCTNKIPIRVKVYPDTKWEGFKLESIIKGNRLVEIKVTGTFKEDNDQNKYENISICVKQDFFSEIDTDRVHKKPVIKGEKDNKSSLLRTNIHKALVNSIKDIFEISNVTYFIQNTINDIAKGMEPVLVDMFWPNIEITDGKWNWREFKGKSKEFENDCGFEFTAKVNIKHLVKFKPNSYVDLLKYDKKEDSEFTENDIIHIVKKVQARTLDLSTNEVIDAHVDAFVEARKGLDGSYLEDEASIIAIGKEIYSQLTEGIDVYRIAFNNPDSSPFPLEFTISKKAEDEDFEMSGSAIKKDEKHSTKDVIKYEPISFSIKLTISSYKKSTKEPTPKIELIDNTPSMTFEITPVIKKDEGILLEYHYQFGGLKVKGLKDGKNDVKGNIWLFRF